MFYHIAKVGWILVEPTNLLMMLLAVGLVLLGLRLIRLGRSLIILGGTGLLLAGFSPLSSALLLPLEMRFPVPDLTGRAVSGIIVLGGAVQERQTLAHGPLALNDAGERVTALLVLARRYPDARVLFSGGAGAYSGAPIPEAEVLRQHIVSLGLPEDRVVFESRSVDTYENARESRRLLGVKPGETWLLVTSAWHMPRAVGSFRQAGFDVMAYPVDFRTGGWQDAGRVFSSAADGLRRTDMAAREWLGLLVYRATGRTNALFPAP